MVEPFGIEPNSVAFQTTAITRLAQVPLTDEDLKEVCFYSFPPIYLFIGGRGRIRTYNLLIWIQLLFYVFLRGILSGGSRGN